MLDPYHVAVAIILDNDARELAIDLAVVGPCLLLPFNRVPRLRLLPRLNASVSHVAPRFAKEVAQKDPRI